MEQEQRNFISHEDVERCSREQAEIDNQRQNQHQMRRSNFLFKRISPIGVVFIILMSITVSGLVAGYWVTHQSNVSKTITLIGVEEDHILDLKLTEGTNTPVLLTTTTSTFPLTLSTLNADDHIVKEYELNSSGLTSDNYIVYFNDTAIQQTLLESRYVGITFSVINHVTGLPFTNNKVTVLSTRGQKFDLVFDVDKYFIDPGVGNDLSFVFAMNITRV